MNTETESLSLISEYLSEIELYFSASDDDRLINISGEEYNHLVKVMRHSQGSVTWVTNGKGKIYKCKVESIADGSAKLTPLKHFTYQNKNAQLILCLPLLKNNDRLEFALEKCTELGVTQFIIYSSDRTLQRSPKQERWNKIVLSAMKQSLRSYLPEVKTKTLKEIQNLNGSMILFDQKAEVLFEKALLHSGDFKYLIIGPEGGLSSAEIELFNKSEIYKLAPNRLRSETAAIVCASRLI